MSGLTFGKQSRHPLVVKDTSFGEASSRTQATDPNRRETLRIRTPLPGLRGEAKWLRSIATPWSAKALTREVTSPLAWVTATPLPGQRMAPQHGVACEGAHKRRGRREACDGL